MEFYDITKRAPEILLETPEGTFPYGDRERITVTVEQGKVFVTADLPLSRVFLRWEAPAPPARRSWETPGSGPTATFSGWASAPSGSCPGICW